MTMTQYGHTSRLPKLAEYIAGPPKSVPLLRHLAGASQNTYQPITTSPRIVVYNSASLGQIHFHHMLYANGAPMAHRPLVVRTMQKKGALWRLEKELLQEMLDAARGKEGGGVAAAAAARRGGAAATACADGSTDTPKQKQRKMLLQGTHWEPMTNFDALRPVNASAEKNAVTEQHPMERQERMAARMREIEEEAKAMQSTPTSAAGIAAAREKLKLQIALLKAKRKETAQQTSEGGAAAEADEDSGEVLLGDCPAVLRVPRSHRPDAHAVGTLQSGGASNSSIDDLVANKRSVYGVVSSSADGVTADSPSSSSSPAVDGGADAVDTASLTAEELLAREKAIAACERDTQIDELLRIGWAVGERAGCQWLHAVWDPTRPASAATASGNSVSTDATTFNGQFTASGGSSSSSSSFNVPASIGLTRPESMGHRIEEADRVRAADEFIDFSFAGDIAAKVKGSSSSPSPSSPIFHHPTEETFLFPTARLLIRIYVPPSAKRVCVRKNKELRSALLGAAKASASSFTSFAEDATSAEVYGLERPFHDVRVSDGDVVYVPRGWGYELFREKKRVMRDTHHHRISGSNSNSNGTPYAASKGDATLALAFEDSESLHGDIVVPSSSDDAAASAAASTADAAGRRGRRHSSSATTPMDRFNWHRYQRSSDDGATSGLKKDVGVFNLDSRVGYAASKGTSSSSLDLTANRVAALGASAKRFVHVEIPMSAFGDVDAVPNNSVQQPQQQDDGGTSETGAASKEAEGRNDGPASSSSAPSSTETPYVSTYQRKGGAWGLAKQPAVMTPSSSADAASPSDSVGVAPSGAADVASSASPSSSLMVSCDCFRVFYKPYPHLSPEQERTYIPAMYTTYVEDFYMGRGGNNPLKHFVH